MPEEIKELDMDKYLVLKWSDINQLPYYTRDFVKNLNLMIEAKRALNGKPQNQYLVLNLDDEIDLCNLIELLELKLMRTEEASWKGGTQRIKVNDNAVALVNAILKTKNNNIKIHTDEDRR